MRTPIGITPPTPGLDREEPEFAIEEDIPEEDARTDEDPLRVAERE
jgi:hypothetical protein